MKLITLEAYVNEKKEWYIAKYGCIDWHWYDEGLYCSIADYISMRGEFTEVDVDFLHRTEFEPEDFLQYNDEEE